MAEEKLIFVGGCMRTGTTILHRVLCSSPASQPYITESWYLLDQLRIYAWSLQRYDVRQKDYFGEKENFDEFTRNIVRNYIRMIGVRCTPLRRHSSSSTWTAALNAEPGEKVEVIALSDSKS